MKQMTFTDAEYAGKRKQTRKEFSAGRVFYAAQENIMSAQTLQQPNSKPRPTLRLVGTKKFRVRTGWQCASWVPTRSSQDCVGTQCSSRDSGT